MAPQSRAVPVLITRPEPQASRFAKVLVERFGARMHPILSPLLTARFLDPDLGQDAAATLILTSETGARAARRLQDEGAGPWSRAFCVGDRTAHVAAQLGFQAFSAEGDAEALFRLLLLNLNAAPFLHLHGRDSRGDLVNRLRSEGIDAHEAVVYTQEETALSEEARAVLSGSSPVAVPLFSPRTAALWTKALSSAQRNAPLIIFALSPAVAQLVSPSLTTEIHVSETPTQAGLIHVMEKALFGA